MNDYRPPMTFDLTDEHIKLLRLMHVWWNDCETGAPEINPKRPYGNSDVENDVARHLGWEYDDEMPGEMRDRAMKIHEETVTALQIVLVTGEFKAGPYHRTEVYDTRSWKVSA